ncbi:MAG: GDSL-type esterase/lipase family protein, partial [Lentisphaeria bacterium]|nr:GDSL-type esterase/lipase family protein [Lentisphaeria bacterium]
RSNAPQGLILKDDNRLFSASDAISCQNNHDCQPHFFYENDRVAMVQMPETGNPARRWRRLAVFGDSITQAGSFAAELMLHLACRFPEQNTAVLNAGIAGNSAAAGLERLDSDLLPMQPDAVLVCFGMNDINRNLFLTPTPDRQQRQAIEQAMQAFNRNLRNIVNRLQQHGITPILLSPPAYDEYRPAGDDPGAPWANSMGLARLRDIACTLASEHRLYFADLHLALSRLYHRHPELAIAPDRVHPDERGHRVIAAVLAAALFPEPPEPRGGLPFPEDDTARAINPWFNLAALRRTGAAALDHRDTRPLRQAAMKYRDADAKTRTFRQAELILAAANAGQLPRRRTDEKAVISKFLATITPRHQGYYNAVLADFQANRHQRKAIFRAADNARQDFFMTLRHLRS